jgi:glycosyltransferase involved in cell wall biosynthesis
MNIWYVSAYDAPRGHSSRTYDHAKRLVERGHRVTFFTSSFDHFSRQERLGPEEKFRREDVDGIQVVWLKTIPYKSVAMRVANMFSNASRAYEIGTEITEHPDVVIGPSVPLLTGLAAYLLSSKKQCAFCFEVRDIWPQALVDLGLLSAKSPITWMMSKLERFLYRKADRIVVVLPFAHLHITKSGIDRNKISWIPNGVDLRRFESTSRYDGGQPGQLHVMYVGGFSTAHSVETILESARILRKRVGSAIRFTIVGAGRGETQYRQLAEASELTTVEFRGLVRKDEIPALLMQADLLVASVKKNAVYQFGINFNKLFDYLAAGRPIVFAGEAPNDPVRDAQAGLTVPPEDPALMAEAILEILGLQPKARSEMGHRGFRYAQEHFDTAILASKLETEFGLAIAASNERKGSAPKRRRSPSDRPSFSHNPSPPLQ